MRGFAAPARGGGGAVRVRSPTCRGRARRRRRGGRVPAPGPGRRFAPGGLALVDLGRAGSGRRRAPAPTTSCGARFPRRAWRNCWPRPPAAASARPPPSRTGSRLARARDARRAAGSIAALDAPSRARARGALGPLRAADRRGRDREGRRCARAASVVAARRRPVRLHLRRGVARPRHATDRRRTLFLPNVEATSPGLQETLLAHLESGRPTRFVVGIDEDPATRCRRPPRARLFDVLGAPSFTCRRCASARGTLPSSPALPRGYRPRAGLRGRRAGRAPGARLARQFLELAEVVRRAARLAEADRPPRRALRARAGRCRARSGAAARRRSCGSLSATRSRTSSAA